MIRVSKGNAPAILATGRGRQLTEVMKTQYTADRDAFDAGTRNFSFMSRVYGAKLVKKALIKAQSGKCAFCESKFVTVAYGDVEHFRPKGGYVKAADGPLMRPGYYWLAYEWSNLYASCQICNQRFKKNWFPLFDEARRARNHLSSTDNEHPVLLDPGGDEDPTQHIEFAREVPRARKNSRRGKATIEMLGLDRHELNDARRSLLHDLDLQVKALRVLEDKQIESNLQDEIRARLCAAILPDAQYSLMARNFLTR